jgi:hypothetical protein
MALTVSGAQGLLCSLQEALSHTHQCCPHLTCFISMLPAKYVIALIALRFSCFGLYCSAAIQAIVARHPVAQHGTTHYFMRRLLQVLKIYNNYDNTRTIVRYINETCLLIPSTCFEHLM